MDINNSIVNSTNIYALVSQSGLRHEKMHLSSDKHITICGRALKTDTLHVVLEDLSALTLDQHKEIVQSDRFCKACRNSAKLEKDRYDIVSMRHELKILCEEKFRRVSTRDLQVKFMQEQEGALSQYEQDTMDMFSKSIIYEATVEQYHLLEPLLLRHQAQYPQMYDKALKKRKPPFGLINLIGTPKVPILSHNMIVINSGSYVSDPYKIPHYMQESFSMWKNRELKNRDSQIEALELRAKEGEIGEALLAELVNTIHHDTNALIQKSEATVEMLLHDNFENYDILYSSLANPNAYLKLVADTKEKKKISAHISVNVLNIVIVEKYTFRKVPKIEDFLRNGEVCCRNILFKKRK